MWVDLTAADSESELEDAVGLVARPLEAQRSRRRWGRSPADAPSAAPVVVTRGAVEALEINGKDLGRGGRRVEVKNTFLHVEEECDLLSDESGALSRPRARAASAPPVPRAGDQSSGATPILAQEACPARCAAPLTAPPAAVGVAAAAVPRSCDDVMAPGFDDTEGDLGFESVTGGDDGSGVPGANIAKFVFAPSGRTGGPRGRPSSPEGAVVDPLEGVLADPSTPDLARMLLTPTAYVEGDLAGSHGVAPLRKSTWTSAAAVLTPSEATAGGPAVPRASATADARPLPSFFSRAAVKGCGVRCGGGLAANATESGHTQHSVAGRDTQRGAGGSLPKVIGRGEGEAAETEEVGDLQGRCTVAAASMDASPSNISRPRERRESPDVTALPTSPVSLLPPAEEGFFPKAADELAAAAVADAAAPPMTADAVLSPSKASAGWPAGPRAAATAVGRPLPSLALRAAVEGCGVLGGGPEAAQTGLSSRAPLKERDEMLQLHLQGQADELARTWSAEWRRAGRACHDVVRYADRLHRQPLAGAGVADLMAEANDCLAERAAVLELERRLLIGLAQAMEAPPLAPRISQPVAVEPCAEPRVEADAVGAQLAARLERAMEILEDHCADAPQPGDAGAAAELDDERGVLAPADAPPIVAFRCLPRAAQHGVLREWRASARAWRLDTARDASPLSILVGFGKLEIKAYQEMGKLGRNFRRRFLAAVAEVGFEATAACWSYWKAKVLMRHRRQFLTDLGWLLSVVGFVGALASGDEDDIIDAVAQNGQAKRPWLSQIDKEGLEARAGLSGISALRSFGAASAMIGRVDAIIGGCTRRPTTSAWARPGWTSRQSAAASGSSHGGPSRSAEQRRLADREPRGPSFDHEIDEVGDDDFFVCTESSSRPRVVAVDADDDADDDEDDDDADAFFVLTNSSSRRRDAGDGGVTADDGDDGGDARVVVVDDALDTGDDDQTNGHGDGEMNKDDGDGDAFFVYDNSSSRRRGGGGGVFTGGGGGVGFRAVAVHADADGDADAAAGGPAPPRDPPVHSKRRRPR